MTLGRNHSKMMRLLSLCICSLVTFATALYPSNSSQLTTELPLPLPTKEESSTDYVSEKTRRLYKLLEQRHFVDTLPTEEEERRHLRSHHRHPKLEHFVNHWEESTLHEETTSTRFAKSSFVDYNGTHPYEVMERRRRRHLANNTTQESKFMFGDQTRRDQVFSYPRPPWQEGAEYKPIRLRFDTWFLDQEDRYGAEILFVKEKVLPMVQNFWQAGEVLGREGSILSFSVR